NPSTAGSDPLTTAPFMPPWVRESLSDSRHRFPDGNKPSRFHAAKIGPYMPLERRSGIEHIGAFMGAHEDHPMPVGPPPIAMPLDGKQGLRRQRRPGHKGHLCPLRPQAIVRKQAPHIPSLGPQAVISGDNAQAPR